MGSESLHNSCEHGGQSEKGGRQGGRLQPGQEEPYNTLSHLGFILKAMGKSFIIWNSAYKVKDKGQHTKIWIHATLAKWTTEQTYISLLLAFSREN